MTGAGRRRGYALLAVLWGTAMLALLAVTLGTNARTDARLARNALELARHQAAVDGAVRMTMAALVAAPASVPHAGEPRVVTIGDIPVTVSAKEAGGLVDLNTAPPLLLAAMFIAAGAPGEQAARLADVVADWRDGDSDVRPRGAEVDAYREAGLPPPANRRFEHLSELRRVLGVTPDLYRRAVGFATLQSRRPGIDPRVAPTELLVAVPGTNRAAAMGYAARRPIPLNTPIPPLGPPAALYTVSLADVYEIVARSDLAARRTTMRLTGRSADPVWLHAWDEGA